MKASNIAAMNPKYVRARLLILETVAVLASDL